MSIISFGSTTFNAAQKKVEDLATREGFERYARGFGFSIPFLKELSQEEIDSRSIVTIEARDLMVEVVSATVGEQAEDGLWVFGGEAYAINRAKYYQDSMSDHRWYKRARYMSELITALDAAESHELHEDVAQAINAWINSFWPSKDDFNRAIQWAGISLKEGEEMVRFRMTKSDLRKKVAEAGLSLAMIKASEEPETDHSDEAGALEFNRTKDGEEKLRDRKFVTDVDIARQKMLVVGFNIYRKMDVSITMKEWMDLFQSNLGWEEMLYNSVCEAYDMPAKGTFTKQTKNGPEETEYQYVKIYEDGRKEFKSFYSGWSRIAWWIQLLDDGVIDEETLKIIARVSKSDLDSFLKFRGGRKPEAAAIPAAASNTVYTGTARLNKSR